MCRSILYCTIVLVLQNYVRAAAVSNGPSTTRRLENVSMDSGTNEKVSSTTEYKFEQNSIGSTSIRDREEITEDGSKLSTTTSQRDLVIDSSRSSAMLSSIPNREESTSSSEKIVERLVMNRTAISNTKQEDRSSWEESENSSATDAITIFSSVRSEVVSSSSAQIEERVVGLSTMLPSGIEDADSSIIMETTTMAGVMTADEDGSSSMEIIEEEIESTTLFNSFKVKEGDKIEHGPTTISNSVENEGNSTPKTFEDQLKNMSVIINNEDGSEQTTEATTISSDVQVESTSAPSSQPQLTSIQFTCLILFFPEVLNVADGRPTFTLAEFKANPHTGKEMQAIAIASSNMWMKLQTMRKVNDIYFNASIIPEEVYRENKTRLLPMDMMRLVLDSVDASLRADPELRTIYETEMGKIDKQKLAMTDEMTTGTASSGTNHLGKNSRIPSFRMNLLFLSSADGLYLHEKANNSFHLENYILSNGILQLTKMSDQADSIQELYDEALRSSVEMCEPLLMKKFTTIHERMRMHTALFQSLNASFKKNAELQDRLTQVKNVLRMKRFIFDSEASNSLSQVFPLI